MIKILENIFNSWLKRRESKYDAGLKREASNIEHIKNSKDIEKLYDFTLYCAKSLYGNAFGDVEKLFYSNKFDEMKEKLDEFEFQTHLSKKTLQIWNAIFEDMENVFKNYENWQCWKRYVNSNSEKFSYHREDDLHNKENEDKAKLKEDIQRLKKCGDLRAQKSNIKRR